MIQQKPDPNRIYNSLFPKFWAQNGLGNQAHSREYNNNQTSGDIVLSKSTSSTLSSRPKVKAKTKAKAKAKKVTKPRVEKVKRPKKLTEDGNYVSNSVLLPEVIRAKKLGKVTPELMKMIWTIAENYSHKSWFINYTYREDMVAQAVAHLCDKALMFNPEKSNNPFAYYTSAINHIFTYIKTQEKNQRNIRDALLSQAGANPSNNYIDDNREDDLIVTNDDLEISDESHLEDIRTADTSRQYEIETHGHSEQWIPQAGKDGVVPAKGQRTVTKSSRYSYSSQAYSMLNPGKTGKKFLSKYDDLNPGEVKIYKPDEYEYDPETKTLTIKKDVSTG